MDARGSGAKTPTDSLAGLRVYMAEGDAPLVEVPPPPSPKKYWTRRGIAEWLVERLSEDAPTLVGIDHGFSFPQRYFEAHDPIGLGAPDRLLRVDARRIVERDKAEQSSNPRRPLLERRRGFGSGGLEHGREALRRPVRCRARPG